MKKTILLVAFMALLLTAFTQDQLHIPKYNTSLSHVLVAKVFESPLISSEEIPTQPLSVYPNLASDVLPLKSNLQANCALVSILGKTIRSGNI
ncbi:MAG: hypothetical protein QGH06_08020, partial [Lutibacter sp.]|nr:hypothetical protein [Lutibacter sp.]